MEKLITAMQKCSLFKDLGSQEILNILRTIKYAVNSYKKGQVIASEGEACMSLGIVLEGALEAQKVYASGKTVVMSHLNPGNIFGEAIIFSQFRKEYPATITAVQDSKVMFISSKDIIRLCSENNLFLEHFLEHLSTKILVLNKKIRILSFETLRQKIAVYLLEECRKQRKNEIILPMNKKALAEYLGVQRPSLSRELCRMRDAGLIAFNNKTVWILDPEALEELSF